MTSIRLPATGNGLPVIKAYCLAFIRIVHNKPVIARSPDLSGRQSNPFLHHRFHREHWSSLCSDFQGVTRFFSYSYSHSHSRPLPPPGLRSSESPGRRRHALLLRLSPIDSTASQPSLSAHLSAAAAPGWHLSELVQALNN